MIHLVTGNLFDARTEAIVNPVNCVGVMGKGLALAFKQRFPNNYAAYRKACATHELRIGRIYTYHLTEQEGMPYYIVNFPTKNHWRDSSKLSYILDGLDALARTIQDTPIHSIAIPPLGCGLGGLDWDIVKPKIENALCNLDCVVYLYDRRCSKIPYHPIPHTKSLHSTNRKKV